MAQTVKEFEDIVKQSNATIKLSDSALRRLRDRKRILSGGDLTITQEQELRQVNTDINKAEADKVKAKIALDNANRILPSLKKVEEIDKQLEREYAAYDRNVKTGGKPNKSRINQLLGQREGLARVLMGNTPDAPTPPASFNQAKPLESTTKEKVTLEADKTAATEEAATATGNGINTPPSGKEKPEGKVTPGVFDPARARAGEEVSMGATRAPEVVGKDKKSLQSLLAQTEFWFDLPDYVFNLDPKLGELLVKAVENNYTDAQFLSEAKLTPWWQKNAAPIRQRIIAKAKFDELRAAGENVTNTEYNLDTNTIRRSVQARARQMGAALDPNALEQVVSKIYSGFLENDELAIDAFIAPYIGKISSIAGTGVGGATQGFSGQALQNYQSLQAIAKANGLTIRDLLPGVSATTTGGDLETAVLQKLATGELDINRIAQDARMIAGTGQPEYVRNLLGQGYDLEQIYSPYKGVMASVLEINPDEIDLKELAGYGLFSDKGQSNIFDFKRALRKDNRWQYTNRAREEVSNATLQILRDFGFQG